MRLNLGCGNRKLDGFLNVDKFATCEPDMVVDLEALPWPFETDSAEEIVMTHVLEHLGPLPEHFMGIIKELYRVAAPGAPIRITVPHPRSDMFLDDPTHVRPITPQLFSLLSKEDNRRTIAEGLANSPLGLYYDVDFRTLKVDFRLSPRWGTMMKSGEVDHNAIVAAMQSQWNVIDEVEITLEAVK
ncbi:hypothetical protein [Azospirillum sp.]|uniref:class I SAM-dependent methyltransferase n=1 Tax=Azospirillum sp. TaxID=34012 RepID=UPI002D5A757C|nr:hypothetical protein [Azospirillum sp.]HYD70979.1 hypothetical protein [Azospirillum sp.]